jgi:arginyl-tRNA synthetase
VTPRERIAAAVGAALEKAGLPAADPLVMPSAQADYQANFAMALAKRIGRPPREVAQAALDALDDDAIEHAEVAGPGFVNFTLADAALTDWVTEALAASPKPPVKDPKTVVIDYSAPNVAKELHVGHLRSTVIGDALARTLEFAGHTVDRQNHLGDWGTQFGMLVEQMVETGDEQVTGFEQLGVLYRAAQRHYESDPEFATRSRERVVALQAREPRTTELWQRLVDISIEHMDEAYGVLGVTLTDADIRGESFYNDQLGPTVDALLAAGLARVDHGAVIVESEKIKGKDGDPAVLVIRKSDGGYGYPATDFATLRHSVDALHGDRLVYVTDARQAQHFAIVFEVCARAGWLKGATAEHVPFGTVLGEDKRPYKTRDGGTVPLDQLLQEAIARANAVLVERGVQDPEIARAIGIGAVKWADLSSGRQNDYVFSFDRMLALRGNTAPYVQYAYVRAARVLEEAENSTAMTELSSPQERALVLRLAGFHDAVEEVVARLEPHRLCGYLFALATDLNAFYDIKENRIVGHPSRMALTALTERTLKVGLDLLGISVPARM